MFSTETKACNWEYCQPRNEHGSSLRVCSYLLIAAQIGKVDWAYKDFIRTAAIDPPLHWKKVTLGLIFVTRNCASPVRMSMSVSHQPLELQHFREIGEIFQLLQDEIRI